MMIDDNIAVTTDIHYEENFLSKIKSCVQWCCKHLASHLKKHDLKNTN